METRLLRWLRKWRILENEYLINAEYGAPGDEEVVSGRRSSEMRLCPAAWQRASADESFPLYPPLPLHRSPPLRHFLAHRLAVHFSCQAFFGFFFFFTLFAFFNADLHLLVAEAEPFSQNELSSSSERKAGRPRGRRWRREPSYFRPGRHVRRGFGEDAEVISERLFMRTSASKPEPDYK